MSLGAAEDYLLFLASELPADVNYNFSTYKNLILDKSAKKRKLILDEGSSTLTGMIVEDSKNLNMDAFEFVFDYHPELGFKEIRSQTAGLDNGYNPQKIALWERIRVLTDKYFSAERLEK